MDAVSLQNDLDDLGGASVSPKLVISLSVYELMLHIVQLALFRAICVCTGTIFAPKPVTLFAFLHPVLYSVPPFCDLVLRHRQGHGAVSLSGLPEPLSSLLQALMCVRHDRESLLIPRYQVSDIMHRYGYEYVACSNSRCKGHRESEQDVGTSCYDRACHGGDEHVDGAGHKLLIGFFGGRERGDRLGKGILELECRG